MNPLFKIKPLSSAWQVTHGRLSLPSVPVDADRPRGGGAFDGESSCMVKVHLHLFSGMAEKHAFWVKASFTEGFEMPC